MRRGRAQSQEAYQDMLIFKGRHDDSVANTTKATPEYNVSKLYNLQRLLEIRQSVDHVLIAIAAFMVDAKTGSPGAILGTYLV